MDKAKVFDDLCKLRALPPYDTPSNHCAHDGIYARSVERKYGKSIDELSEIVKFNIYQNNVTAIHGQAVRLYHNQMENLRGFQ